MAKGLESRVRVTPLGIPGSITWINRDRIPPEAASALVGVEGAMQEFAVALPSEPVGVGAMWDVTYTGEIMGIRYTQTATHELVSLEGNRGQVRLSIAQTAPRQEVHSPAFPGGHATLETWYCHGGGDAAFDLDRLTSAGTMELSVTGSQTVTIPEWEAPLSQEFRVEVKVEMSE